MSTAPIPVSCLILTYNEQERLPHALAHALRWADEVVVVDKGSTDATPDLARAAGARFVQIPFSRQGHEDIAQVCACATHDWVWGFTAGEVPTPGCIQTGRRMIGDHVDLVRVPMKYYSFGLHHPESPWAGGWQPRLYHRRRVTFTGIAHDPIRAARATHIPFAEDCHVLHQTHGSVERFISSHLDYMLNEQHRGTAGQVLAHALRQSEAFDAAFAAHSDLLPHALGWKFYWIGVALHAWERTTPGIADQYRLRAAAAVEDWGNR